MNKYTREHYPASKLPRDLRGPLAPTGHVTVTVVTEEAPRKVRSLEEIWASAKKFQTRSAAEIDAHIRAMRDEWDE